MNGHVEHWQRQEAAEASQRAPRLTKAQMDLHRKEQEIRELKDRLEALSTQLGDTALAVARKDHDNLQLSQSLGALSSTVSVLCELHLAGKGDLLNAEMQRLATNYLQMKALVSARRVH